VVHGLISLVIKTHVRWALFSTLTPEFRRFEEIIVLWFCRGLNKESPNHDQPEIPAHGIRSSEDFPIQSSRRYATCWNISAFPRARFIMREGEPGTAFTSSTKALSKFLKKAHEGPLSIKKAAVLSDGATFGGWSLSTSSPAPRLSEPSKTRRLLPLQTWPLQGLQSQYQDLHDHHHEPRPRDQPPPQRNGRAHREFPLLTQ